MMMIAVAVMRMNLFMADTKRRLYASKQRQQPKLFEFDLSGVRPLPELDDTEKAKFLAEGIDNKLDQNLQQFLWHIGC
eukprot:2761513-Ditylum_brightwellii.AAC.1